MIRRMGARAGLRLPLRRSSGHGSTRRTQHARERLRKEVRRPHKVRWRLPVTLRNKLRVVVLMAVLVLMPPAPTRRATVDGIVVGAASR